MIAEMVLTGEMLIGARSVRGTEGLIHAVNPATGEELEPVFGGGTAHDVDAAPSMPIAPSAWSGARRSWKLSHRAFWIWAMCW